VLCDWQRPADNDFLGIIAWMSTSASFTCDSTTEVYRGAETPTMLPLDKLGIASGSTVYVKVAGYDQFGDDVDTLNISPSIQCDTLWLSGDDAPDDFIESRHIGIAAIHQAHLNEAIIGNAYIKDLAVDTIKIAGNAVTAMEEAELAETVFDFFPQNAKGNWASVTNPSTGEYLQVAPVTVGGQVLVMMMIYAEVIHIAPDFFPEGIYVGGNIEANVNDLGQLLPKIRYRVVRDPDTTPTIVMQSGPQTISATGYSIAAAVSRIDQPSPGQHVYRVQFQWMRDIYDAGTADNGVGGDPVTSVVGTGTRWLNNCLSGDTFQYLDVGGGVPGPIVDVSSVSDQNHLTVNSDPAPSGTPDGAYRIVRTESSSDPNSIAYTGPTELTMDITSAWMQASEARA
jgi:hypothetical protein